MTKAKVKKGDIVTVIAGADKGKSGKVLKVEPKKNRVTVEGVAIHAKAVRRSQTNQNGGIEKSESPIHISNVMNAERYQARLDAKKQKAAPAGGESK